MKQQTNLTAIQWLVEQLAELDKQLDGRRKSDDSTVIKLNPTRIYEQAKQMEKEQIMDAHIEGQRVFDKHPHTHWTNDQAEQYYNEMYK